jgi:hypothetical protein
MADKTIVISVKDEVSTAPATKFRDMAIEAATAGNAIDRLKASINSLPTTSVGRIATELNKIAAATAKVTATQTAATAESLKAQLMQQRLATEIARTTKANTDAELSALRLATAQDRATTAQERAAQKAKDAAAAQEAYNKRLKESTTVSDSSVKKVEQLGAALEDISKKAKLSRNQILTLQYTASDIVSSLGSGISPMTIALQQGPQVAQVFTKELSALGARFGLVIGAAGALAAAVGILGLAYNSAANDSAKLNNALKVTGNYAGLTEGAFKDMADSIAESSGKSVQASSEVAQAFVSSGRFQRQEIEQNSVSVLKLARLTDTAAEDIGKSFNAMADGPTAFAESLNKSYHFLSSAQLTQIRQLEETGQKTKATQLVSKQLYDYLATVDSQSLGPLSDAWKDVQLMIAAAGQSLKEFVNGVGPGKRIAQIQSQLTDIANSQKINPYSPDDTYRIESLNQELGILYAQVAADKEKNDLQSKNAQIQQDGYESSKRIGDQWLKTVDNVGEANRQIEKFRTDIKQALEANPNDALALAAQAKQAEIEKKIREANMPVSKQDDKTGETRALAIAKINAELDKQVSGLGKLRPQREMQQQLDQYELELASRKIKLSADERAELEKKLQTIQNYARAQEATDRIYEEVTGPLNDYNAAIDASNALLKSNTITQADYTKQLNKAQEVYATAQDPLRDYNKQLEQQMDLLKRSQPNREIMQQLQQADNTARAAGIPLIDATTGALTEEGQALQKKLETIQHLTGVQQQYDSIYAQTVGSQTAIADAVDATTMAYQNGIISAEQYGVRMNNLAVQAAQLRIDAGNAMPGDAALASFGAIIDGYKGMLSGLSQSFGDLFVNITDGFSYAIAGAIMGTESLGDALKDVAQSAVQQLIGSLIKLGIQYAVNAAIGESLGSAGAALSIAQGAAVATAWAPAAAAVSLATFGANGVPAGAAIASTNALSMGFAMAGFSEGGYTGPGGKNQVAGYVHAGEVVWSQDDVANAGGVANVEAMRAGRASAVQGGGRTEASVGSKGGGTLVKLTVINNANNSQVSSTQSEDESGNIDLVVTVDSMEKMLASRVASGRGALHSATKTAFGLKSSPTGG